MSFFASSGACNSYDSERYYRNDVKSSDFGTESYSHNDVNTSGFGTWNDIENDNASNQALYYQQQIEKKQRNILDSSSRSKQMVYESEDVGNETAHELVRQGEQLRRTEQKLDKVDRDLATSQRHITSLKSMFGGIKNYFSRNKGEPPEPIPEERDNKLRTHLNDPSNREQEEEREKRKMENHPGMRNLPYGENKQQYSMQESSTHQSSMQVFDSQLDDNLDELSSGLSRLKGLARGLGEELDDQNDDIDRITTKAGKVDTKIEKTNTDVKRLLRR